MTKLTHNYTVSIKSLVISLLVYHQTRFHPNGRCDDIRLIMKTMESLHNYNRIKSDNRI